MALPGSGQISFNDVRNEMSQSFNNYGFFEFSIGYNSSPVYTPINVNTTNSQFGLYGVTNLNSWHGYDRTLNYASDGTNRVLYSPSCLGSSMILFDVGTTNRSINITISGSAADFAEIGSLTVWYGKPWQADGGNGTGNATNIYTNNFPYVSGINTTVTYSYTYDSGKGTYIYIVAGGTCL